MNNIIKLVVSLAVSALIFGFSASMLADRAIASEYVSNFTRLPLVENRPPQAGTWKLTPTVIVCEYAPVERQEIDKAVAFWERLGYRFYTTQYKHDPLGKCRSKSPQGYIVIHLRTLGVKMDETSLAQTHFYVDNQTKEIDWAIIYVKEARETVLEHELGHALGFLHYNMINHLMNAKWAMGGWDNEGLENKRR
jgi:hypothetical protein